jgi:prepilin-type N-terminal cleavage/methylation domain-containing protein
MDRKELAVMSNPIVINCRKQAGFTLVELLIALCLSSIVASMVIFVFLSQQESYTAQIRVSALQQNLRTAMNILSRDIRMAGYCTSPDKETYKDYIDWDPRKSGTDEFLPMIHGINNITGVQKYRKQTDVILLVKASEDRGKLSASEHASANGKTLFINDLDLDEDSNVDFAMGGRQFGVIMKSDFSDSQLFKIMQKGPPVRVANLFRTSYAEGDIVARADIIIYRIDDANTSFPQSVLERKNAGNGNQFQVVAEGITDLQLRYILNDASIVDDPSEGEKDICAVEVSLTGEVEIGRGEKRIRSLVTILKIRNT